MKDSVPIASWAVNSNLLLFENEQAIQILQPEEMVEEEVLDASPTGSSDQTTYHELKLSGESDRNNSIDSINTAGVLSHFKVPLLMRF